MRPYTTHARTDAHMAERERASELARGYACPVGDKIDFTHAETKVFQTTRPQESEKELNTVELGRTGRGWRSERQPINEALNE